MIDTINCMVYMIIYNRYLDIRHNCVAHMILLCIAAFLVGVALCRVFRVLILAPALIAILVVVAVRSAYVAHGPLHSGFEFALLSISLQFGYASHLLLAAVRGVLQRVKSGRMHAPTAAPPPKAMTRQG
jgi:hypothetical protein